MEITYRIADSLVAAFERQDPLQPGNAIGIVPDELHPNAAITMCRYIPPGPGETVGSIALGFATAEEDIPRERHETIGLEGWPTELEHQLAHMSTWDDQDRRNDFRLHASQCATLYHRALRYQDPIATVDGIVAAWSAAQAPDAIQKLVPTPSGTDEESRRMDWCRVTGALLTREITWGGARPTDGLVTWYEEHKPASWAEANTAAGIAVTNLDDGSAILAPAAPLVDSILSAPAVLCNLDRLLHDIEP